MCYPAMGKAMAQSLSRPGGEQVTPDQLDPRPRNEQEGLSAHQIEGNRRANNYDVNSTYFRAPMTEREMDEAQILKQHRADHPLGRSMNEADAITEIWKRRTPRDLSGRDYE